MFKLDHKLLSITVAVALSSTLSFAFSPSIEATGTYIK
jgi:hypothetical protein